MFKKAFLLIENQDHLTKAGLEKIVAIKASMNLGLSEKLLEAFSHVASVERPKVKNKMIEDMN